MSTNPNSHIGLNRLWAYNDCINIFIGQTVAF